MQSIEMYAPASPFSRPIPSGNHALSGVYRQVGLETSVSTASSHQLVTLLYDGFFDAISQARGAMRSKDVETKAKALSRAIAIVDEGLKACLDMSQGGEIANNLNALYGYITLRITQANLHNDEAPLQECVNLMTPLREAWIAIGQQVPSTTQGTLEVRA